MAWAKYIVAAVIWVVGLPADAAVVTYVIRGDVVKTAGSVGSSDFYQLDGSAFTWTLQIEADMYTDQIVHPDNVTHLFETVYELVVFDRAGGLNALVTSMPIQQIGGDATMRDVVENTPQTCSGCQERITFQGNDAVDIPNMEISGVGLNLSANFLNGDTTFPRNLTLADAESYDFGGTWSIRTFGGGDRDEYQVVNLSLTMVPIPTAAWLFGSALGLLGWLKRRRA